MPLVIPEGYGLLAYRFALATDPEVMVITVGLNVLAVGGEPQAALDAKADAFAAAVPATMLAGGYTFLGCQLRLRHVDGGYVLLEAPRDIVGTAAAVSLPNNCAYLIHKRTARSGRRGQGRMFLPPWVIAEADINNAGMLTGAALSNLQAVVDDAFPLDGLVLLHDSVPSSIDPDPILSLVVDRQIATQRRRLRS